MSDAGSGATRGSGAATAGGSATRRSMSPSIAYQSTAVRIDADGHRDRPGADIAAERLHEPVHERDLRRLEPGPCFGRREPVHTIDLGEGLTAAAPGRPLHLEGVRDRLPRVEVALDRPGVDD